MHITGISVYVLALFANLLDGKMKIKEIVCKLSTVRQLKAITDNDLLNVLCLMTVDKTVVV